MNYPFLKSSILGAPLEHSGGKGAYTIVGAGISGLLLGFFLKKNNIPFKIFEAKEKAGGVIDTLSTNYGLAETAANGFLWSEEMQYVADTVGAEITPSTPEAKAKYIVRNKKLKRFPLTFAETLFAAAKFLRPRHAAPATLAEFGNIYLGKTATQQLLDPAMTGIYAAPAAQLSFPAVLPDLAKTVEKNYIVKYIVNYIGRAGKNRKGTHSFKGGMGGFIEKLAAYLKPDIEYNVPIHMLPQGNCIITAPAYAAAGLFESHEVGRLLNAVFCQPVISAGFFFKEQDINIPEGFGCVIPHNEGLNILGIRFDHYIFPRQVKKGFALLTCIVKGQDSLMEKSDEAVKVALMDELRQLFPEAGAPVEQIISRHRSGIPLYSPQLYESWFEINSLLKKDFPKTRIFGNYTGKISIREIAEEAANWVR